MLSETTQKHIIPDINWDVVVDSSKLHIKKPEIEIYLYAQKQVKAKPKEILFIDNAQENLIAPKKLGWQTFWFNPKTIASNVIQLKQMINL